METKLTKIENRIDSFADSKKQFEKSFRPFIEKNISAETRRAYGRVVREFFALDDRSIKPVDVFGGEIG